MFFHPLRSELLSYRRMTTFHQTALPLSWEKQLRIHRVTFENDYPRYVRNASRYFDELLPGDWYLVFHILRVGVPAMKLFFPAVGGYVQVQYLFAPKKPSYRSYNEGIGFGVYGRSSHAIVSYLFFEFQRLDIKDSDSKNLLFGTYQSPCQKNLVGKNILNISIIGQYKAPPAFLAF